MLGLFSLVWLFLGYWASPSISLAILDNCYHRDVDQSAQLTQGRHMREAGGVLCLLEQSAGGRSDFSMQKNLCVSKLSVFT